MRLGDRHLLFAATFLRALATGMVGVVLGVYLARLEFSPARMGLVVGAGLSGAAVATLVAMLAADRIGRRPLFLLREGLVEMDVPTRQSYLMAVVRPEERTFASGATQLVRVAGWAVAPALAGLFMQGVAFVMPLLIGASLKVLYDVLLYVNFRKVKPPEERDPAS